MKRPDFEQLRKVLFLDGEPKYIPFYELSINQEVMKAIIGEPDLTIDSRIEENVKDVNSRVNLRELQQKFILDSKFHSTMGYDYVPLVVPLLLVRNNVLSARDRSEFSKGTRTWVDENRGVIEDREDFENYPWPDLDEIQESFLPLYEFAEKNLPEDMMIICRPQGGVLENVMWLMGTAPFFKALYRDPALVRKMFEKVGGLLSFSFKLAAELDMVGALVMGDDMGYKTGPFMSPENYRRYVFPWQKRCVDEVHRYGKPFILHSCGNLKILMEDIIEYVGIDAKHSYEDTSYPVTEYKKEYGDRIAILGGIDMDKLCRLPRREFSRYVKKVISECAPGGGYALGCGNSVSNYIKLENYLTMLEIGRKYGKYPQRAI